MKKKATLKACFFSITIFLNTFSPCLSSFNYEEVKNVIYSLEVSPDQPLNRDDPDSFSIFRSGDPILKDSLGKISETETPSEILKENAAEISENDRKIPTDSFILSSQSGQEFLCKFPSVDSVLASAESRRVSEANSNITLENVTEALKASSQRRKCLKKTVGWWTYEFCYGDSVSQYHLEGPEIIGPILTLGKFDSENPLDSSFSAQKKSKSSKYHSQKFSNGTLCDLNSKLRSSEVRFYCEEDLSPTDSYLYRVDEPETCQYCFTIHTGSLCALTPFLPADRPPQAHAVTCHPLLSAEQYTVYTEAKQRKEEYERKKREEYNARELADRQRIQAEEAEAETSEELEDEEEEEDDTGLISDFDTESANAEKLMETMQEAMVEDLEKLGIKYQLKTIMVDASGLSSGRKKGRRKKKKLALDSSAELEIPVSNEQNSDKPESQRRGEQFERLNRLLSDQQIAKKRKFELKNEDADDLIRKFEEDVDKEKFANVDKEELQEKVEDSFQSIIDESEKEMRKTGLYGEEDIVDKHAALKTLTESLRKLLDDFDESLKSKNKKDSEKYAEISKKESEEESVDTSEEKIGEPKNWRKKYEDRDKEEDSKNTLSGQIKIKRRNKDNEETAVGGESERGAADRNEGVRVRVSRIKTPGVPETDRGKIVSETQRIEEQLSTKLKDAGFKPNGASVQVKIITSGYYDDKKDKFHVLNADESDQFTKLLINMLGGETEESKEEKKQKVLERGYSFDWQRSLKSMKATDDAGVETRSKSAILIEPVAGEEEEELRGAGDKSETLEEGETEEETGGES